jgi:hypothetical protein
MDIDAAITHIAQWLDEVDVATAAARVAEAQSRHHEKAAGLREPWEGDAAMHEGAHAVAAERGGLRVKYARLLSDGSGCVSYEAEPTSPVAMIARVAADLAGIVTELLDDAHSWRQQQLKSCNDLLLARLNADVARGLMPGWQLNHRFFAATSCCAVVSNWDTITRVAQALRASGHLTGARVAALSYGAPQGVGK